MLIDIRRNPSARELAWFGVIAFAFLGVVGTLAWRAGFPLAARGVWIGAVLLVAVYYAVPPLRRPVFRAWMAATFPIGWTVSHLLLVIIYYGIVTPVGMVLRITGHDPMGRRFDATMASYWVAAKTPRDVSRYFKQF